MKNSIFSNKKKIFIFLSIILLLMFSYVYLCFYNFRLLKKYDNLVFPNSYIEDYEISYFSYDFLDKKIDSYADNILNNKIKFSINSKDVEYSLSDIGVSINNKKTVKNIKDFQSGLSKSKKLIMINRNYSNKFNFVYDIDKDKVNLFVNELKKNFDYAGNDGYFDTSEGVKYIKGTNGFTLDVDKSINSIYDYFNNTNDKNEVITLDGTVTETYSNDSYEVIDTMTSSFTTVYMPYSYLRNINLNNALSLINGKVLEPGEVFSYCKEAGPFDRDGYVLFYDYVGNGVCQIATTVYNAALLGGLEIVQRGPHSKQSLYVPGGLDATVVSYSNGWCADMQFKNTYKYPIYIKAYPTDDIAHVEFWSHKDAKEGKEYQTSSVQIGPRGFKSYLHVFQDGVEIDKREIATTWYTE